jgi:hypothetical protein
VILLQLSCLAMLAWFEGEKIGIGKEIGNGAKKLFAAA